MSAISVQDLRMSYGPIEAVRGLDLDIHHGEIYALLGPNGAGKTTTVEILEGFRVRSGGRVRVLDDDPGRAGSAWRSRVGIVFQDQAVEPYLSVAETLRLFSLLYPRPLPADELLETVGLEAEADRRVHTLSGGQRRRLDLALALVGDPDLVFLDEPTTGFDPSSRRAAWETVRGLRDRGKTILLTTHYMEEAEVLADRVGVIVDGRLVAEGEPASIAASQMVTQVRFRVPADVTAGEIPLAVEHDSEGLLIKTSKPAHTLNELTTWAIERGLELADLTVSRPSLEEIYLEVSAR